MGIEEVKKEILDNARAQAKLLNKEAEAEKKEIMSAAESRVESIKEKLEKETAKSIEQYRAMAFAEANSQVKKTRLALERDLIEEVFSNVKQELLSLPAKKRESHLKSLSSSLGKDFSRLYCSKKDIGTMKKFKPEEIDITGGVVLENSEGNVRLDMSYETLLEGIKQENVAEISKTLFN